MRRGALALLALSLALRAPLAAQAAGAGRDTVLEFDFPGLRIGVAEYPEGPTGATVFHFPGGVMAAVDVRGGAPGTVATDFLRLGYESAFVDAISFAGGSSYGLAAAAGVAAELRDRRGSGDWGTIATVPGAIIFDLGDRRFTTVTPDEALGRAALRAARPGRFPLGPRGAGRFATHSSYFGARQHSGQGGAFRRVGPTRVAVFTVVNALGTVVDRAGRVVRCANDAARDCGTAAEHLARHLERRTALRPDAEPAAAGPSRNTTITLVVTDQKLDFWALQRLAVQVHTSMSRAIHPFHTENDGDVLFAVTTGQVENRDLRPVDLGVVASEVAWDAVLASVPALPAVNRTPARIDPRLLAGYAGRYSFGPGAELTFTRDGNRLFARATGERAVYGFARGERTELFPSSDTTFFSRNSRGDHLRFERDGSALVLNPGPWGLPARRTR